MAIRIKQKRYRSSSDKRFPLKWILLLLFLVCGAWYGHRAYLNKCLRNANKFFHEHNLTQAEIYFQKAVDFPLSKGKGLDGLACLALVNGQKDQAETFFQQAETTGHLGTQADVFLTFFLDEGLYAEGSRYKTFLSQVVPSAQLEPYFLDFAALALGNREMAEARRNLTNTPAGQKSSSRYKTLLALADQYEREKEIPVVLDRQGEVMVYFDLEKSDYAFSTPSLFTGWPSPAIAAPSFLKTLESRDEFNRIYTTLELNIQRSVFQAMRGYQGTFVAMDPNTGAILAAYGTDMDPLTWTFEPGSVMKVLTYGCFLQNQGNPDDYAPKSYPSSIQIDKKVFYDWTTHGRIQTVDEGMAVSCNIMFGNMGIDLGLPKIKGTYQKVLQEKVHPSFFSPAIFGKMTSLPQNAFELARFSIGLDYYETTSLGVTQIAALVAQKGTLQPAFMLEKCETIDGKVYREWPSGEPIKVFSPNVSEGLKSSMIAAVNDSRGTARRAKTDFMEIAIKSGTAGDSPYDSIMIGFFPAENPKVAFGFCLYKGGKSEINGAKVAKAFQNHLRVLAPKYLEP